MKKKNQDQQAIMANQKIKERDYWLNTLEGELVTSRFPYHHEYTDKDNGKRRHEKDKRKVAEVIDRQLCQRLMGLSGDSDYGLHVVLVAGLAMLLGKYTGQKDIIVGTPIYKQEMEGEFINTVLPLRIYLDQEHTVKDILMQVKELIVASTNHQRYPIEFLAQKLGIIETAEGSRLFATAILLKNIHNKEDIVSANPGMLFSFCRIEQSLDLEIEYISPFYNQIGVQRLVNHFEQLLTNAFQDVNVRILDLEMMLPEEKELLDALNLIDTDYPREKSIHQLFEEQASRAPAHVAVFGHGWTRVYAGINVSITYGQLNVEADKLAGLLIDKGVLIDNIVGILMERSIEMIIAIMGILKSGGAYLPIDPEFPQERIEYMLKDSNAKILINKSKARISKYETNPDVQKINDQNKNIEGLTVLNLNHLDFEFVSNFGFRNSDLNSSNLAYIIYTSGTTGKPKGVLVEHKNVVRLLFNDRFQFDFNDQDVWSLFHSYNFDFSVW
ncbi:MAG TPA: AMP-binding protein, partial [Candidatus Kapabacteria bacterium]|nr:AMP-binding protein [Candidatus Kapabacteria bacterium]